MPELMRLRTIAIVPAVLLTVSAASACSVPVFRYALERWDADPYEAIVLYRNSLSPAESTQVARLEAAPNRPLYTNLMVRRIDIGNDSLRTAHEALWKAQPDTTLPRIALYPLSRRRDRPPVWHAPLDAASVDQLLSSPIRRELARRIAAGETAIWVLVPSGDRERDRAVMDTLRTVLPNLQKSLKLPEPVYDASYFEPSKGVPLKIAFSTLVLSATDPAEHALLSMLFEQPCNPDSITDTHVFPIFGRGRSLITLPGDKVTTRNLTRIGQFLSGPCACTVKQANPGNDLVFAVNWDAFLRRSPGQDALPPLSGFSQYAARDTLAQSTPAAEPEPKASPQPAPRQPAKAKVPAPAPAPEPVEDEPVVTMPDTMQVQTNDSSTAAALEQILLAPEDDTVVTPAAQSSGLPMRNALAALAAVVALALAGGAVLVLRRRSRPV